MLHAYAMARIKVLYRRPPDIKTAGIKIAAVHDAQPLARR